MRQAKRILCLILCFAMLAGYIPVPTHAEDLSQQGLCTHHPEHIVCSYAPAVEAIACSHQHDDSCYVLEENCGYLHDGCCTEASTCEHVCSEEDGCLTKTLNCLHEHDEECGYVEAREAVACDFVCADCSSQENPIICDGTQDCSAEKHGEGCEKKLTEEQTVEGTVTEETVAAQENEDQVAADEVDALINALPDLKSIQAKTLEEQQADYNQVQAAYDAYEKLTDSQKELLPPAEEIFGPYFDYFNSQLQPVATHSHPVCGSICSCASDSHSSATWTAWDGTTKMYGGYYYLTKDLVLDSTIILDYSYTTYLCLNGHSITSTERVFDIYSYRSLVITDCVGTGKVESTNAYATITNNKSLTVWGGTISNSGGYYTIEVYSGTTTKIMGGTVHNDGTGTAIIGGCQYGNTHSSLTISGGRITNQNGYNVLDIQCGDVTITGGYIGGTVTISEESGGTFTIHDGTITGNVYIGVFATTITGGNISGSVYNFAANDASISVSGGTIGGHLESTGATASITGGKMGLNLAGPATISAGTFHGPLRLDGESTTITGGDFTACETGYMNGDIWICGGSFDALMLETGSLYLSGVPAIEMLYVHPDTTISAQSRDGTGSFGGDPIQVKLSDVFNMEDNDVIIRNVTSDTMAGKFVLIDHSAFGFDPRWTYLERSGNNLKLRILPHGNLGSSLNTGVKWYLADDVLTFFGTGAMPDYYDGSQAPWYSYAKTVKKIVVEEGITSLSSCGFENPANLGFVNLTEVVLPASLQSIGSECFQYCRNIKEIQIPEQVTSIGIFAFEYCEGLESFVFPAGMTTIPQGGFNHCSNLKSVTIPATITTVSYGAFDGCTALKDVYYGGSEKDWNGISVGSYNDCLLNATIHYTDPCADGHTEVIDEAVEATCTKDGLTEGSHCSVCGEAIVAQEVIPAGHVVENGICTRCKAYGTHGDNLTWEFNETDGTFTISGSGVMQDIGSYYSSWSDYVEQITAVVIHEGVTSIGRLAFDDCVNLKTVSVPGSVLCIGEGAFVGCKNLETVVLSEGLEEIGKQAFTDCNSLKEIQLPETLTTIRTAAFSSCDSLVEIKIPDSVTELEQGIFRASGISCVELPENLTVIPTGIFYECKNLTEIQWPSAATCIDASAFAHSGLSQITIPAGITAIDDTAFAGSALKTVTFLGDPPTFGDEVFDNVIANVYYYDNGKWNSNNMRQYDGVLTWIPMSNPVTSGICGDNLTWTYRDGTLTVSGTGAMDDYSDGNQPWYMHQKNITRLVIEGSMTRVGNYAFAGCTGLTGELLIPESVTDVGQYAFSGCTGLTSITLGKELKQLDVGAFDNCTGVTTVTFTGATPPVIHCDFKTLSSSKVIFRVPGRSYNAYREAINEKRGSGSGFQYVYTPLDKCGENLEWSFDKTTGILTISGSGPMIDLLDMREQPWYEYQSAITGLEIGEGVTTIGKFAFQNCSSLSGELSLPSSMASIGSYAFSGCSSLTGELYIPESVTAIGNGAFSSCTGLTGTLVIPDNVTSLGSSVFSGCIGLTGVDIGSGVKAIPYGAFSECTGLDGTLVLPDTVTSIGSSIISGCTNLDSLVLGSGVKEIPDGAFFECSNLKSINLGKVTTIGYLVFYNCTSLTEITFQGSAPSIEDSNLFDGITATVYYPANDATWDNIITQQYYGNITWVPYGVTVEPDPSEPIEPAFPVTGTVTTLLNVRNAPSHSADIVDKLQPGTKVEILQIETINDVEWGLIDIGWIMMHYVDLGNGSGTTDNTCGKDLIWSFDKDTGVLSISGTGAMRDFTVQQENPGYGLKPTDSPWLAIEDQVLEIVIKEGVTTIGTGAFANFENLNKVSLPDSLISIGDHAFNTDTSLTELRIPDGVTYLGDFAFAVCVNLPSVTLPMGITRIGASALDQCLALETLIIPANVTSIGHRALAYCTNLREVTFEGNAPSFDETAFHGSNFTAYYQQKDPTWIPNVMQSYGGTVTWEAIYDTYTVTLDYQDPMVYNEVWEYTPGTAVALPTNVVRSGYIFLGWYEGDTKVTEIPADATGDKTYVAKWQEKETVSIDTAVQNYAYDGKGKSFVLKDTDGNLLPVAAGTDWLVPCSYMAVTVPFGERESSDPDVAYPFHQGIDLDTGTGWDVVASRAGTVVTTGWGDAAGNYVQINHGDGFSSIYTHLSSIGVSAGQHVSAGQYIGATGNTGVTADDHLHFGISLNGVYVNPESYVDLDGNDAKFFIDYSYSGIELNENGLPYHPGLYGIRVTRPETATHKAVDLVIKPAIRIVSNSGFCGYDLYWEFAPDSGILTISGNGSMYDYSVEDPAPWNVYAFEIKEIHFDSESMSIGDCAFADCIALTSVTIPKSIYRIGNEAFSGCKALNTITFAGNSPYIEENTFSGVTATAYYPTGWNWYEEKLQDYGGTITWIETGVNAKKMTAYIPETMAVGMSNNISVEVRPWNAIADCIVSVSNPDVLEIISTDNRWFELLAVGGGTSTVTITEQKSGLQYSKEVTVVEPQSITVPCTMKLPVPEGNSTQYFSFTPDSTGVYRFSITHIERLTQSDVVGYGDGIYILKNGDGADAEYSGDEETQIITVNLTAGEPCIIALGFDGSAYAQTAIFTAERVNGEDTGETTLSFVDDQREIVFFPGQSARYHLSVEYNGTEPLSWRSSNPSVVEVEEIFTNGCQYTIKNEGTAVITVSDGVLSDSITITTKAVEFVELYLPQTETPEADYFHKDFGFVAPESGRYAFSVSADDGDVSIGFNSWSSDDDVMYSYGENSSTAFRTMKKDEICRFYVSGNASSYTIRVSKASTKPLSMKLIATEPYAGAIRFGASFTPGNACDRIVKWEIDNRDIASENRDPNTISPVQTNEMTYEIYQNGTLTVTATSENGLKASLTVTVQENDCQNGHIFGEWIHIQDKDGNETGRERRECINCDVYQERKIPPLDETVENRVVIDSADLAGQNVIWIDGVEYALQKHGDKCYVDLPDDKARTLVTYTYSGNSQSRYPIGMKVWMLENENGIYTATRQEIFDDILQYSGMSIRVTGKKGIRMITSIEQDKKNALVSGGLAGYTLREYGTVVAWSSQLDGGNPLVLGRSYAMSNYAYKKGVADPVFAYNGSLMQYTNVLVNFSDEQCKNELALRPYMILEDENGKTLTIYGGIIYRSIGYIAYQNRDSFEPGTAEYNYIWDIIHYVYGDVHDDDFVHAWTPSIK